jgi:hypothetical protein
MWKTVRIALIVVLLALLGCMLAYRASAATNRYYNSRGYYQGSSRTVGSNTYYYNSRGYSLGRSWVSRSGRTHYYNSRGYSRGYSTKPSRNFYRSGR